MYTITAFESITLDGVMQGPGRADEDTRGGFTQGGWSDGYQDDVLMKYAGEGMRAGPGMLFGHRTYADVLGYWSSIGPNPFIDSLINADKFVVSRAADTELPYANSELLAGDPVKTVAALKERYGRDLMVMGSGELVRTLLAAGLVDRFALQIYPIILGSGTRLFGEGDRVNLTLERSIPTTTGVLLTEHAVKR
jgi:dihydrofolate reductase